jgi:hypothetical protein
MLDSQVHGWTNKESSGVTLVSLNLTNPEEIDEAELCLHPLER